MATARETPPLQLSRHVAVETPEHVIIELELAGLGSRFTAALYDLAIVGLLESLLFLVMAGVTSLGAPGATAWAVALTTLAAFAVFWGYFVLCEGLLRGQTPGKRRLGIRVIMDTGHPVTLAAAAVRNLLRIADAQPLFSYLLGGLFVFFHGQHKRLGDLVAGTIVVRDRPHETRLAITTAAEPAPGVPDETGAPELADDEYRLLEQFLQRRDTLEPLRRLRLATDLASRFAERHPRRPRDHERFLVELHEAERRRRAGRLALARGAGGGARGATSSAAGRFVARKQGAWEAYRNEAILAEGKGLRRLDGAALTRFAAQYREVAADLARARTYGVDPRVIAYLERVVSAGHNALYGLRGVRRVPLLRLLLRDLPVAVVDARAYVLAAFLLFAGPAAGGYLLVRERPAVAYRVLPAVIIERAESGVRHRGSGPGYAETPSTWLPIVATSIIANNVQVAFMAFAGGVLAGIGTVYALFFNGLLLGAIVGFYANLGIAGWILTFVAGHGVLEMTAIFIAGGAGLLVARAILAPGDLTRRDALVIQGGRAIRLVAASACLLLLAGTIEGFLSASDAAPAMKLAVSTASAGLLVLLALAGRRAAGETAA